MAKQIVVCMDGTWCDPTEQTNVHKLFQTLPGEIERVAERGPIRSHYRKDDAGVRAFYLEGVGARGRRQGLLGGSMGIGLHDRVIDAYTLVSQVYQRGDKIWIFGFSRGAWSARALGGLIAGAGLLDAAEASESDAAEKAERIWVELKHGRGKERGEGFWEVNDHTPVRLIGVWDTVGALGVPLFNGLRLVDRIERALFDFADLRLSTRVEHGRHALAIDETRFDFTPTLWEDRAGIRQVWFAGAHSDVGGGYLNCGLSDVALEWMVDEVNALGAGLPLDLSRLASPLACNFQQDRHDDASEPIWQLRPQRPREIAVAAVLHPTVIQRLEVRADYRPQALREVTECARFYPPGAPQPQERVLHEKERPPSRRLQIGESALLAVFAQKWWNAAGVATVAGDRYRVEAAGEWSDKATKADAGGYRSSNWLLGFAEGSRRVPESPWFALIAAMHRRADLEAGNPDSGNRLTGLIESTIRGVGRIDDECQLVATPHASEFLVARDGFLYFFANDSAFSYSNNSGFLEVTVTRTG